METEVYSVVHQVERTHWFFVARRLIIASLLDTFADKSKRAILLDIGGGTGGMAEVARHFGQVIGVDYSEKALSFYRQYHPDVCLGDAAQLPFENDSLDFILALDLLEHLEDDAQGLSDFYRVLKPGGRALFTVPAFKFLWGRLDDVAHHYRRYTKNELARKVQFAGFRVLKASYLNTILFPIVAVARWTESLRKRWTKTDADLRLLPSTLNFTLANLFGAEARLLRILDLPFGVSIVCVAEK